MTGSLSRWCRCPEALSREGHGVEIGVPTFMEIPRSYWSLFLYLIFKSYIFYTVQLQVPSYGEEQGSSTCSEFVHLCSRPEPKRSQAIATNQFGIAGPDHIRVKFFK